MSSYVELPVMDSKDRIKWLDEQNPNWSADDRVVYLGAYTYGRLTGRWCCSTVKTWIPCNCECLPLYYLSFHDARKKLKEYQKESGE